LLAACAHHLFEKRWPNGFICPNCQSAKAWALDSKPFTYQRNNVTKLVVIAVFNRLAYGREHVGLDPLDF